MKEGTVDALKKFFKIKDTQQPESTPHQSNHTTPKINDKPQTILLTTKTQIDKILDLVKPQLKPTYQKILYDKLDKSKSFSIVIENSRLKIIE